MLQSRLSTISRSKIGTRGNVILNTYQHGHRPRISRHPTVLLQQHRSISIIPAIVRVAFNATRVPLFIAGSAVAGATIASNKFQDLADSSSKIVTDAKEFLASLGENLDDINISIPEMNINLTELVSGLLNTAKDKTQSINHIFTTAFPATETAEVVQKEEEEEDKAEESQLDSMIAAVIQEEEEEEEEEIDEERLAQDHDMRMKHLDHQFMLLCRKFGSIRDILVSIQHRVIPHVPTMVMVGSRSQQEMSMVDFILGQPFLSKQFFGNDALIQYEFTNEPELKDVCIQIQDDDTVYTVEEAQKKVEGLMTEGEAIKQLRFRISGPNLPYLNIYDVPPTNRALCDQYIGQDPSNIIMAVFDKSRAEENAHTTALCDRYDPLGRRTMGVMIDTDRTEPQPTPLFSLGQIDLTRFDQNHVDHEKEQRHIRHQLFGVIEQAMGRSIYSIVDSIKSELEETSYLFKVMYNDQKITAASYLTDSMDNLKLRFKDFAAALGKPQLRFEVRRQLEQNVLNICAEQYWSDAKILELSKANQDDFYWLYKMDLASAAITKSGIGRITTQLVMDVIMNNMERLVKIEPFQYHPKIQKQMVDLTGDMLRLKFLATSDQVENTIKPYKYEVEVTEEEWKDGVKRTTKLLEKELTMCEDMLWNIKKTVGRKRLRNAIKRVLDEERSQHLEEEPPTHRVLEKAKEALFLQDRARILKYRLAALKSRQCKTQDNKQYCPEIFLNIIAEKLTYTAVMFIQIELLNDFFFNFPVDVIDDRIVHPMNRLQIETFAKENPTVQKHLILQDRKVKLEKVMDLLNYLVKKHDFNSTSSNQNYSSSYNQYH